MKVLRAERFGPPADVLRCVDVPDPGPPGPGEVVLDMLAMPINPADLLQVEGRYGDRPPALPLVPGAEGVGRISAVGEGVEGLSPGDLAAPLASSTFVERMRTKASAVIALPAHVDPLQAAMLKANPATAEVMLTRILPLEPGDFIVQNAANSAVGLLVARFARERGIGTVNVVRREAAAGAVREARGTVVIVADRGDADAARQSIAQHVGSGRVPLAFDAIGGEATNLLAGLVTEGGRVVNYGLLSGKPCAVDPHHLVFRDVSLVGFWLARWFRAAPREDIRALYATLVKRLSHGAFATPVAATYPFARVAEAVAHAARGERGGKILLVP